MAAKTKVAEAPFDANGSLMHYPENRYDYSGAVRLETGFGWEVPPRTVGPEWRSNVPFTATMRLEGTRRGRSAAYFMWHDQDGRTFPMFITDMADLVCSGNVMAGGIVSSRWMVAKRGSNFGIRLATPEEAAAHSEAVPQNVES